MWDWLCLLSPWVAFICFIIWDTRDKETSSKLLDPLALFTGILAIGTMALAIVAYLQWQTLEKSDQTLKQTLDASQAGQRAFVFVKALPNAWLGAEQAGTTTKRRYTVELENSGNSQTKNLVLSLYCPHPQASVSVDPITENRAHLERPRLLGPKQAIWAGACEYTAEELEEVRDTKIDLFVAAIATYEDIFNKSHRTEYCVKIVNLKGDFRNPNETPTNNLSSCDRHMCADDECSKNVASN